MYSGDSLGQICQKTVFVSPIGPLPRCSANLLIVIARIVRNRSIHNIPWPTVKIGLFPYQKIKPFGPNFNDKFEHQIDVVNLFKTSKTVFFVSKKDVPEVYSTFEKSNEGTSYDHLEDVELEHIPYQNLGIFGPHFSSHFHRPKIFVWANENWKKVLH